MPTTSRVFHGRLASSGPIDILVEAERVGPELLVHLVGGDDVLQALAIFPYSRATCSSSYQYPPSRSTTSAAGTG